MSREGEEDWNDVDESAIEWLRNVKLYGISKANEMANKNNRVSA